MVNILAELTTEITREVEQKLQPVTGGVHQFVRRLRNPAQASFELGCGLIRKGLYKEAIYRFKFTLWRQPKRAGAWYNLAICHFALGEMAHGIAAVKQSLAINPKNEAALYLLATLQDGRYADSYQPHTTPPEILKSEFLTRAETFDVEELGSLNYTGHLSVFESLLDVLNGQICGVMLDAGCGTGLLGELVRPLADRLVGVDLSAAMLSKARARKTPHGKPLYDHLLEFDVRSHLLQQKSSQYHAIVASNLAPVMGGLAPFLDGAVRALHPGGWLLFNTLPLEAPAEGYRLNPRVRRFFHSEEYLRQVAQKSGLVLFQLQRKPFYERQDGRVIALRKNG